MFTTVEKVMLYINFLFDGLLCFNPTWQEIPYCNKQNNQVERTNNKYNLTCCYSYFLQIMGTKINPNMKYNTTFFCLIWNIKIIFALFVSVLFILTHYISHSKEKSQHIIKLPFFTLNGKLDPSLCLQSNLSYKKSNKFWE